MRTLIPFTAFLLLISTLFIQVQVQAQVVESDYRTGEVYLKLQDNVRFDLPTFDTRKGNNAQALPSEFAEIAATFEITEIRKAFPLLKTPTFENTYLVKFNANEEVSQLLRAFKGNQDVEYVEQVPKEYLFLDPNDTEYQLGYQTYLDALDMPEVWGLTEGSADVVVAIVDDAVKTDHQDLANKLWTNPGEIPNNGVDDDNNGFIDDIHGWDRADNDNNPIPPSWATTSSGFSHGTHVAGIIGAQTNNNLGVASIGINTSIMAVKCTRDNTANTNSIEFGWSGVEYAIAARADIINMSWGGTTSSITHTNICDLAESLGIVMVAAAGNYGNNTPLYPAAYPNVIGVAAVDNEGVKPSFSNYGDWVDISAPGVLIRSAIATSTSAYGYKNGTSMSTPVMAAIVSLLKAYNPSLSPAGVRDCLYSTTNNIDGINGPYGGQLGTGMVNPMSALACAASCLSPFNLAAGDVGGSNVTLNWAAISGAISYEGRIREAGTSNWVDFTSSANYYTYNGTSPCKVYEFQVKTDCGADDSNYSEIKSFEVPGSAGNYCESNGNSANHEWIAGVVFEGINQQTGNSDAGYSDFTCDATATVATGDSYTITLTPGYSGTAYQEYFTVWIDWNQDGDFSDAGEAAFVPSANATSTITGTINVPDDAAAGPTRMRVSMKWIGSNSPELPTACMAPSVFKYGEVEDYTVNVEGGFSLPCIAPNGLTSSGITETSANINWAPQTGSESFKLEYRAVGSSSWLSANNIALDQIPYSVTGLTAGTDYQYRVIVNCTNGNTDISSVGNFTTSTQACNAPTNLAASNISETSATITWTGNSNASEYDLRYREQGTNSWNDNTYSVSAGLSGLEENTSYEVQIRSKCGVNNYSNYSSSITFTTDAPACNPPGSLSASTTIESATVSWAAVGNATSYIVQTRPAGGSWSTVATTANLSRTISDLNAGSDYEFRVMSNCSQATSNYSGSYAFTTQTPAPCNTPSGLSASNITENSASITWTATSGVVSYSIVYREAGTNNWSSVQYSTSASKTLNGLDAGKTYDAKVLATCAQNASVYSSVVTFTTDAGCTTPTSLSISNVETDSATATWTAPANGNANSYAVRYRVVGTSAWSPLSASTTSRGINGLTANTNYEVQVRSYCGNNAYSEYSSSAQFTTSTVTCSIPSGLGTNNVAATSATLTWANISVAEQFTIRYKKITDNNWQQETTSTTSFTLTGLAVATAYEFQVQADCNASFSSSSTFVTPDPAAACDTPSDLAVINLGATSATVSWNAGAGTSGLVIKYRKEGQPGTTLTAGCDSDSSIKTLVGLIPNTDYEYQIQATCGNASSSYSGFDTFTTLATGSCGVPSDIVVSNISGSQATATWNAVSDANSYFVQYRIGSGIWTNQTVYNTTTTLLGLTGCSNYQVRVRAACAANDSNFSSMESFSTPCDNANYCISQGINANHEWIAKVAFGSIQNPSGSNAGYGDYTNLSTDLSTGQTYSIVLTPGFAASQYNEYWTVWIDYNRDGDFDDLGELAFDAGEGNKSTVTGSIAVPLGVATGSTRMRVAMRYSTAAEPCVNFNYGEVEDYTLNINNNGNTSAPGYCEAAGNSATAEYIQQVQLGTISNQTGSDSGYGDYTSISTDLAAGGAYPIVLTPGFSGTQYNEYWRVWIDLNQDSNFSNEELVFDAGVPSNNTVSGNIVIPSDATTGITRMRVIMKYNNPANSCGTFSYGEVEDYTINISGTASSNTTADYCPASGNSASSEFIAEVAIGEVQNPSGSNDGYGDYTGVVIALSTGDANDFTLTPGFASTPYNEYWSIFIDYNQDGDFNDTGEEVFDAGEASKYAVSGSFSVPSSAANGETRMRVIMRYKNEPDACGSFNFGEVEDYTVSISNPYGRMANPDIIDCEQIDIAFEYESEGLQVSFENFSEGQFNQFFWSLGDGETSEEENPVHQYEAPGSYYFNVTAIDSISGCQKIFAGYVHVFGNGTISTESNGLEDGKPDGE